MTAYGKKIQEADSMRRKLMFDKLFSMKTIGISRSDDFA